MWRRIEPLTALLVLTCVIWTLVAKGYELSPGEAGALSLNRLWEGEYTRLLSAAFLHETRGWLHIIFNSVGLLIAGSIVARECGRPAYLAFLLLSIQAAWAASLPQSLADTWHMGISGGLTGLIGLLLALEWSHSRSWGEFLRQRNTIVLLLCILVGAALSLHVGQGVAVSHAGHLGGLAFGLLAGLAYYSRRGVRRVRGALVALLLGVLPLGYVAFPLFDADFFLFKGRRAYAAEDWGLAETYYARAHELRPDHPVAGARLALLREDASYLDGLRDPRGVAEAHPLLEAHLRLAEKQLRNEPAAALALVERAVEVAPGAPNLWMAFGEAAVQARVWEPAYIAYREAARWLPPSRAWVPAQSALGLFALRIASRDTTPEQRAALAPEGARLAREASLGLAAPELGDGARAQLEQQIARLAQVLGEEARRAGLRSGAGQMLGEELERIYWYLAENTKQDTLRPLYRYQSALWWWQQVLGPDLDPEDYRDVQARFRAALLEARSAGNGPVQALVEQWFRARGLPVPEGDLADDEDDG